LYKLKIIKQIEIMKKTEIQSKLNEGYKIVVCLTPSKDYTKLILKTYLKAEFTNVIHSVYYNHCKEHLTESQLNNIELYNEVKNLSFRDKVYLNIASKQGSANEDQIKKITMLQVLKQKTYTEL